MTHHELKNHSYLFYKILMKIPHNQLNQSILQIIKNQILIHFNLILKIKHFNHLLLKHYQKILIILLRTLLPKNKNLLLLFLTLIDWPTNIWDQTPILFCVPF